MMSILFGPIRQHESSTPNPIDSWITGFLNRQHQTQPTTYNLTDSGQTRDRLGTDSGQTGSLGTLTDRRKSDRRRDPPVRLTAPRLSGW